MHPYCLPVHLSHPKRLEAAISRLLTSWVVCLLVFAMIWSSVNFVSVRICAAPVALIVPSLIETRQPSNGHLGCPNRIETIGVCFGSCPQAACHSANMMAARLQPQKGAATANRFRRCRRRISAAGLHVREPTAIAVCPGGRARACFPPGHRSSTRCAGNTASSPSVIASSLDAFPGLLFGA